MYVGLLKLDFCESPNSLIDAKTTHAMVERLRMRFKVCVRSERREGDGYCRIIIASLADSEGKISQTFNKIAAFCESSGFGRVESEWELCQSLDDLVDDEEDDDDDDGGGET
jgi:uncharacterized protein YlxP (DUF503 family)